MADMKTPGGLVARPVSTSYFTSDQFLKKPFDPCSVYTSPKQAILCTDSFQSMYSQMLCGLIMRHQVLRVGTLFASSLVRAIRFLQHNYQQLAHDISIGTLSPEITHPSIKQCVAQILKPDPELADFITQQCSTQNWERIITRIWPNTKYIDVTVTGSTAQYIPTLHYYTGGLPLVSTIYCSSECFFGLNLNPFCNPSDVSYTILPNMGYFEFLPLDDDVDDKTVSTDLVDLAHVEIGKCYELVVTTYAGLYRYRVGDILRVTGFYNSAPQFGFVRRKNAVLSIDMEKTDEEDLQRAIENASMILKEFNTSIVEYTSFADVKSIPGHYVIYWELWVKEPSNRRPTSKALNRCCLAMEESLNVMYRHMRVVDKCIGALEIRVVKNGTFEKLMDYAISRGASISQYKVPRCVSLAPIIELFDSRVVSVHFSPDALHGGTPKQRRIE